MRAHKIFAGAKLRNLRVENGLTQAAFAARLGMSTSYLNQLENNQRHLSAAVLLALATQFGVDIATLSGSDTDRLLADVSEALADPLVAQQRPSTSDLQLVVRSAPAVARALLAFHEALRRTEQHIAELDDRLERSGSASEPTPYEEVRDFFHYENNYVHELDVAAEQLAERMPDPVQGGASARLSFLSQHLERSHGVRTVTDLADGALRRFDPASRILRLSGRASPTSQAFQIAHQLALVEHRATIDAVLKRARFASAEGEGIGRIGLANYFSGALVLPYRRFAEEARRLRYDLVLVADRFGVSLEQVCHRLSTLQRPGAAGLPFFFAKLDQAGNITKRHSATKLQFARFGAACPLWIAHAAFAIPGRIVRQLAETPDGQRYLNLAIAVTKPSGGFHDQVRTYSLALGCEVGFADAIVYGDDLPVGRGDAYAPIGISCRLCDRIDCHQRAMPPLKRRLLVDENQRLVLPYSF